MLISPVDLQQARKDAAERFYAIGMKCLPEGWTYEFRKRLTGVCWPKRKHIAGPRPVTRKSLYIWLHECAHAHLHGPSCRKTRHVKEYEAERWAHETMRANGVPVPKVMTERAKAYVARRVAEAERRGTKVIDKQAKAYAEKRK